MGIAGDSGHLIRDILHSCAVLICTDLECMGQCGSSAASALPLLSSGRTDSTRRGRQIYGAAGMMHRACDMASLCMAFSKSALFVPQWWTWAKVFYNK